MSYREPIQGGGKSESPINFTLRWNAWEGAWMGKAELPGIEESCMVNMRDIVGAIIEPALFRVTGKSEPDSPAQYNLYSTLGKALTQDSMDVYLVPKGGGKSELVAKGIWKDIKTSLPPHAPRPKFTRTLIVALRRAHVSIFEEEVKGKPGEYKDLEWEYPAMVALNMTGWSPKKGYEKSAEEQGFDPLNCTGVGFMQTGFDSEPNARNKNLPDTKYPLFKFQEIPKTGEKSKLFTQGGELYEKLEPWLKKMWGGAEDLNPVSFQDEDPDEKDVKNDDDLPF